MGYCVGPLYSHNVLLQIIIYTNATGSLHINEANTTSAYGPDLARITLEVPPLTGAGLL